MLVAAAALIDAEGRVLVQQRPEHGSLAGLWEFPGGKLERGETPEQALVRELREELAITVEPGDLEPVAFASADPGDSHLILLLFLCRRWEGAPRLCHAQAMQWMFPEELVPLPMPVADRPLVKSLVRLLPSLRR